MALCLRALIALTFTGWHGQPFDFSACYLLELGFPAFTRPGNEEQNQAVPGLAELVVVGHTLCHIESV
jgi:hypothetical protein